MPSVPPHIVLGDVVNAYPISQVRTLSLMPSSSSRVRARKRHLGLKPGPSDPKDISPWPVQFQYPAVPRFSPVAGNHSSSSPGAGPQGPRCHHSLALPNRSAHSASPQSAPWPPEHSQPRAAFTVMVPTRGCRSISFACFSISCKGGCG